MYRVRARMDNAAPLLGPYMEPPRAEAVRQAFREYILPQYVEEPRDPPPSQYDWLTREIDRLNLLESAEDFDTYEFNKQDEPVDFYNRDPSGPDYPADSPDIKRDSEIEPETDKTDKTQQTQIDSNEIDSKTKDYEGKEVFALTPLDEGYFKSVKPQTAPPATGLAERPVQSEAPKAEKKPAPEDGPPIAIHRRDKEVARALVLQPQRQIRQNPNLSPKSKTLVAESLDKLRLGTPGKDYRMPVSLLPANLRWLKISHPDDEEARSHGEEPAPGHSHPGESTATESVESMFGVTIMAATGAALAIAVIGFAIGWYTLSKKAKAAADVDYPAYGVTGPTMDTSGDRKLAHSAHMYHYQHQKQQIIAMERNGMEQRKGSLTDPESEEENEEGDYTVYECPGFATTGDMEVKNPMFNEDPTPTPGKVELVKPQPKE
ncbi:uncharacterized protein LOC105382682 isoform X2 [Plutella xylostella]|uniref:uncharacterized protein LOC105382682 isoform X2 n=1 Tax=Plutella xylostella TaxID=51655 RepID=UPI0020325186|nr:uncharacterized protein LOC105382682 isoform X2 [Plutella xylostella]